MAIVNITAQTCSGSWALQRPLTSPCVVGQWVGWQNIGTPLGCPVNPVYTGVQTNTFTFSSPVSTFYMDFTGFDGTPLCAKLEVKVNGVFYPLSASNIIDIPGCTSGSLSYVALTSDGYLTVSISGGAGLSGAGRITINNVNAISVSISTNDGSGTTFSGPFNCTTVPLKLESFIGQNNNCKALINWKTGIEFNVRNIEVQKSEDGITFYKTGEVNPKGSDSQYSFITNNSKDTYFRLKIIDIDGSYAYSETIYLKSSCDKNSYTVVPNPAFNFAEIVGLKTSDKLVVLDMLGKVVKIFNAPQNNKLDIQSLPRGIYIFQISNAGVHITNLKVIRN